jgi:hypothetical protein
MTKAKMVEVTSLDIGKTERMTLAAFYRLFGKDEGKEILAGYLPHIVAVMLD